MYNKTHESNYTGNLRKIDDNNNNTKSLKYKIPEYFEILDDFYRLKNTSCFDDDANFSVYNVW